MSSIARNSSMYVQMLARVCGSRPTVGSSRNSTRGECISPRAISSRRRMPPENSCTLPSRRSHSPTISSTTRIRSAVICLGHPVQLGVEAQVLGGRQVHVERRVLEHQTDVAAHVEPLGDDVVAGHRRRTGRRLGERAQHLDRRRLAGTVGPEEAEDLPRLDVEGDPVDGGEVAVALDQPIDLDCWDS